MTIKVNTAHQLGELKYLNGFIRPRCQDLFCRRLHKKQDLSTGRVFFGIAIVKMLISGMAVTEKQINELKEFFNKVKLPPSIQLDAGSKISDVSKFAQSHLNVLRHNNSAGIYEVFYIRLSAKRINKIRIQLVKDSDWEISQ